MKAVVLNTAPELVEGLEKPVPATGEVLIRTRLSGICNTDLELARGYMDFKGIPGHEFVGEVVEENLTNNGFPIKGKSSLAPSGSGNVIKPDSPSETNNRSSLIGKRVVGEINAACGECEYCIEAVPTHCQNRTVLGILGRDGCMAEYLTLPLENIHAVPDSVSDEAAVFVEPLAAAFEILEQVDIAKGQRVAVMGDGKLGLLCAMVLSTTGAEVTLMGKHERKLALVAPYGVKALVNVERGGHE